MRYLLILTIYAIFSLFIQIFAGVNLWTNHSERRVTILWLTIIFFIGFVTDYYSSVIKKIWIFPGNEIIGTRIFSLPIEEFLFFLIIPYFALVLYKALVKLLNEKY